MANVSAISSACNQTLHASRESGTRRPAEVLWIVLHSTEGGTAASTARYFNGPNATGSAHLVVDDSSCYRCLRNDEIPWAAPGANRNGFHIEQCGFAHYSPAEWYEHVPMLQRASYKTALHCDLFGIPPIFRTAAEIERTVPGVTTHAECTKAFGGDHTDPGKGWPRDLFMVLVRGYLAELRSGV